MAKESGVSQTAPYRHFETKALYASVAQDGFNKLSKAIHVDVDKVTKKQIVDMAIKYIEFGLKNANTYDLMFGTAVVILLNILNCLNQQIQAMKILDQVFLN